MACKYCDENRKTNDEGACSECEPLEGPVDRGLEEGRLPVIHAHGFGPIEGVSNERHPCCVCGVEVAEADHPVYRDYRSPRINFRGDLHFHDCCSKVWRQRAMRG